MPKIRLCASHSQQGGLNIKQLLSEIGYRYSIKVDAVGDNTQPAALRRGDGAFIMIVRLHQVRWRLWPGDGNSYYPIIHKQKAYSYGEEVRLIYQIMPESGWEYDWTQEEVPEGVYVRTDHELLIGEIIISPNSPKWYIKLIQDICHKYGIT